MTNPTSNRTAAPTRSRKLTATSADGKWETFLAHAGLRRYVPTGIFFAYLKVNGKRRLETLKTDVKTVALDNLALKRKQWRKPAAAVGTVGDGIAKYEQQLAADLAAQKLKPISRDYNVRCLTQIKKSWPGLALRDANSLTTEELRNWTANFTSKKGIAFSPQFHNNCINVFHAVLAMAGLEGNENPASVKTKENPNGNLERRPIGRKPLNLPTAEQFEKLVYEIEHSGAGQSKDAAALVRFLAYSGTRISEAVQIKWRDVNWDEGYIVVPCLKRRFGSSELPTREVPFVPAMRTFLESEKTRWQAAGHEITPDAKIVRVCECQKSLTRACAVVGCARITHHDLRHLFVTFCIEAGIDIPTVSRWAGHSDGGALAMRVYGHLRREHSLRMAQRVTFGLPAAQQATLANAEPTKQLAEIAS
jgi:integrase